MEQIITDKWLNVKEICYYTGLSPSTIHRAIQRGELKVSKRTLPIKLLVLDRIFKSPLFLIIIPTKPKLLVKIKIFIPLLKTKKE